MVSASKLLAVLLLGACAMPAIAQDQGTTPEKPEKIVLEQKLGSVMTSTGGDYETANLGKILIRDESMMLSEGAKATVVYYYDNGKRKCTEKYEGPNTFVIDDSCKVAAYLTGNSGTTGMMVAGTALIVAAIIGNGGGSNPTPTPIPPPVSGSNR